MSLEHEIAVAMDLAGQTSSGRLVMPAGRVLSSWIWAHTYLWLRVDVVTGRDVCRIAESSAGPFLDGASRACSCLFRTGGQRSSGGPRRLEDAKIWCDKQAIAAGWTLIEEAK